ncbi:MAG TPA: hypothetical protein VK509_04785 [Polyangiales bacterium]|nr:hypothetical protein [Polyangiales bacterium]
MSGSGDSGVLGYELRGRGPAQVRLLEWLSERVPDCELDIAVAQRSPAGPWAFKLHAPNRVPTCAALLQAESWVERVAVRPQHVYVRVGCERLCEWVAEGFADGAAAARVVGGAEGRGRSVLVRAVDVDALVAAGVPRPLRMFRETAVARSVAALLRSRGFEVGLDLLAPGRETYDDVWAAAPGSVTHTVVVGSGVPLPSELERGDHVVHLPVGEVDVRHGPLRARNGGSVSADDVVAEVAAVSGSEDEAAAYGEAVLALLLLATPRGRRIQLDDAAVRRETETFACLATPGSAGESGSDGGGEVGPAAGSGVEESRSLAAELDLIATNAARAATALDPALLARSLRSIGERREQVAASAVGLSGRRLQRVATPAIEVTLGLAGIGVWGAGVASERRVRAGT